MSFLCKHNAVENCKISYNSFFECILFMAFCLVLRRELVALFMYFFNGDEPEKAQ